jgi:hypothetical protein
MRFSTVCLVLALLVPSLTADQLRYSVNWPSGLSLGEASLSQSRAATAEGKEPAQLEFQLDASIPGFAISDLLHSRTDKAWCSVEFQKKLSHGSKKTDETLTFHADHVERKTRSGGASKIPIAGCGRDALTFLAFVRSELRAGRIPPGQKVFFGAAYDIRAEFGGTQMLRIGDSNEAADRILFSLKGPASQHSFEVFFARDAVRTPLLFRAPLPLGTFSLELLR